MEIDTGDNQVQVRSVWMVTREYDKLAGAGGVKDVCRQLAEALAVYGGCKVRVVLPRYGFMDPVGLGFSLTDVGGRNGRIGGRRYAHTFDVDMHYVGEERREAVAIWQAEINGVLIFLVEADRFATKRAVYTYTEEDEQEVAWQRRGGGHFDYFAMNILLQKAALDLMILLGEQADVVHCHDGHAAILPAVMREVGGYRHFFRRSGALVTIHNAGQGYHQEVSDLAFARAITGLPTRVITRGRLGESFDPFIVAADYAILNTVSEQYGRELQQTAEDSRTGWLGHALLGRGVTLAGVTNGIDPASFDTTAPETLGLTAGYNVARGDFAGKEECKRALLATIAASGPWERVRQYGVLDVTPERPLGTFIGRLTSQKGVDILIQALHALLSNDPSLQFLFLGSGAFEFEEALQQLSASDLGQGRVCFLKGYDAILANKVYASGDFFVIPSRYEPCGLTDYIAQLFGNLPIVHRVGGLVKVLDGETGFTYSENTPEQLAEALAGALRLYRHHPHALRTMRMAAVERIWHLHTWEKVMESYLHLYRQAMIQAREQ
ncbi:MAG: glycogen/starch synthase [Desulfobulbus sp.]|nr:glycogen/starch synthase [Desulfobulbus sp.]